MLRRRHGFEPPRGCVRVTRETWTCPDCGREFARQNARHSCFSQAAESLFAPYPHALPIYRAVRDLLLTFPGVRVEATKTQAAFRAQRRFAFVWVPHLSLQQGLQEVVLSFSLRHRLASTRVKEAVEPSPGVWMHHVVMPNADALDAEARAWLRESYETRGAT